MSGAREHQANMTVMFRLHFALKAEESVQMTAMVAGAREQLAGVREKAVADATVRELEMLARTASCLMGASDKRL